MCKMKKFLILVLLLAGCTNKPASINIAKNYPSCHWDGTEGKNDWNVVFQIDDVANNKMIWRQQVAAGLSEKAAENLCKAYVSIPEKQ